MADAYTGQDIIHATDYEGEWLLGDFADGTVAELSAPNALSTVTTGYNGNCLGAHNEPGRQRSLTIRLIKASSDDKRLNKFYTMWKNKDPRFKPLKASFTKNIVNENGVVIHDTVDCFFGLPTDQPTQQTITTGDTEQEVSVYMITFGNSERSL